MYHNMHIAPLKIAIAICLLMMAIVAQGPKMKQQPIEKMMMCVFSFPADFKLKNGISLTSR